MLKLQYIFKHFEMNSNYCFQVVSFDNLEEEEPIKPIGGKQERNTALKISNILY